MSGAIWKDGVEGGEANERQRERWRKLFFFLFFLTKRQSNSMEVGLKRKARNEQERQRGGICLKAMWKKVEGLEGGRRDLGWMDQVL